MVLQYYYDAAERLQLIPSILFAIPSQCPLSFSLEEDLRFLFLQLKQKYIRKSYCH